MYQTTIGQVIDFRYQLLNDRFMTRSETFASERVSSRVINS
jgi:hypothetical protein